MKHNISELTDHLFFELDRLSDVSLTGENLTEEISRARAITDIATQVINSGRLMVAAYDTFDGSFGKRKLPDFLLEEK